MAADRMDKWRGKVAVVTGASAGIGAAIVEALVDRGMTVVGLARREVKIQEMADKLSKANKPGKLYSVKADLRKEEDILAAFQWVDDQLGGADVLVNNAGLAVPGSLKDGKTDDWRDMLTLNVLALCQCTREFLISLENRDSKIGHVININSVVGHSTEVAMAGVYTGTKHAVTAIGKCLRRELALKGSTVKVTSISPGLTRSEQTSVFLDGLGEDAVMEASDVAQTVIDVLSASSVTQICEAVLTPIPYKATIY